MERTTRHSKKRDAILTAICGTDCHPSAEWVYQTLKPTHPDLSLGTVYRNLTFFQQTGLVRSVGVVKGQERFDGNTSPHCHFICNDCGAVIDLPKISVDSALSRQVCEEYGFGVAHHELTFYGVCKNCMHHNHNEEDMKS